jgi:hypothetical protein
MKKNRPSAQLGILLLALCVASVDLSFAGDKQVVPLSPENGVYQKTKRDVPDESYSHPGEGRLVRKLDLDGDFNYDGIIDNADPTENGEVQEYPPGLVVGVGELTRMLIRLHPHKAALRATTRLELEVIGINRSVASGDFGSLREEIASMGHIRIWADSKRSKLLLDSQKTGSRIWSMVLPDMYNDSLVNVPRAIWVEGVKASGAHTGDIRLDVRLIDVRRDRAPAPSTGKDFKQVETKQGGGLIFAGFRPAFDHVLLTVTHNPHKKGFINDNAEHIWSTAESSR